MSVENKRLARRIFEELGNRGNMVVIPELVGSEFVNHQLDGHEVRGPEGMRRVVGEFRTAFPDVHVTVDDQIAEADIVVTRWTAAGTHRGPLGEVAPTGKRVKFSGISMMRFDNVRLIEEWELADQLGLLRQVGAIIDSPTPSG